MRVHGGRGRLKEQTKKRKVETREERREEDELRLLLVVSCLSDAKAKKKEVEVKKDREEGDRTMDKWSNHPHFVILSLFAQQNPGLPSIVLNLNHPYPSVYTKENKTKI